MNNRQKSHTLLNFYISTSIVQVVSSNFILKLPIHPLAIFTAFLYACHHLGFLQTIMLRIQFICRLYTSKRLLKYSFTKSNLFVSRLLNIQWEQTKSHGRFQTRASTPNPFPALSWAECCLLAASLSSSSSFSTLCGMTAFHTAWLDC